MDSYMPRRRDGLRLGFIARAVAGTRRSAWFRSDLALPSACRRGRHGAIAARECRRIADPGCSRDGCGRRSAARPGAQARSHQPADRRSRPLQRHPRLHDDALGRGDAGADPDGQAQRPRAPCRTRGRSGEGRPPGHHCGPAAGRGDGLAGTFVPGVDARAAAGANRPGRNAGSSCGDAVPQRQGIAGRGLRGARIGRATARWSRADRAPGRRRDHAAGSLGGGNAQLPLGPRPALTLPTWTAGAWRNT